MSLHRQTTWLWKKQKNRSYGSGTSFPSSHSCTRRRNQSPGLDMSLHYDKGWCCSHRCLVEAIERESVLWFMDSLSSWSSNRLYVETWVEQSRGGEVWHCFWSHGTSCPTYWFRSGLPPSHHHRCIGTRWLCQCRSPHCDMGCSHSHWCLQKNKRKRDKRSISHIMVSFAMWFGIKLVLVCVHVYV